MVGFEIYLINQPENNSGNLVMSIFDNTGKLIDNINVDLSKVHAADWYKAYTSAKLNKDAEYTLKFSTVDCVTIPYLQCVDEDYLPSESTTGNILISYAYSDSTFSFQNKIIISDALIAIWLILISILSDSKVMKVQARYVGSTMIITALLSWNYMYNSMDNMNTRFDGFQSDSERLVTDVLIAEQCGIWYEDESKSKYGLGSYEETLTDYTDDNWLNNYSRNECSVVVDSNDYSCKYAKIGNCILFGNGDVSNIINAVDDGDSIILYLDENRILNPYKYGSISDAIYCDANKKALAPLYSGKVNTYESQYGLQGKVFRHLVHYMDYEEAISNLHLMCSMLTAFIFAVIIMLIFIKYNSVFAGVFLYTFWLSPWIVNFARNLYWVEFTWFAPMALGLFCALNIENKKHRIISYIAIYITIVGKCLCGYEYITVIMMGAIAFLLVDLIKVLLEKDKNKSILLFRTIVIIGFVALLGFITAICIHSLLRGNGDIIEGIKNIYEQDVLRRTNGTDLNEFDSELWPSFNASVWETYCRYFHFNTEIVTGITGNMFSLLCIVPICFFINDIRKKRVNIEFIAMYIVFFLTSISWFCLAKGHSYVHPHMNYVLWYFGFVQTCIYIILKKIKEMILPH